MKFGTLISDDLLDKISKICMVSPWGSFFIWINWGPDSFCKSFSFGLKNWKQFIFNFNYINDYFCFYVCYIILTIIMEYFFIDWSINCSFYNWRFIKLAIKLFSAILIYIKMIKKFNFCRNVPLSYFEFFQVLFIVPILILISLSIVSLNFYLRKMSIFCLE